MDIFEYPVLIFELYFTDAMKIILISCIVLLSFKASAQDANSPKILNSAPSFAKKGTHWIDYNLGLSLMNSDLAFEDPFLWTDENRRNYGFIFNLSFRFS